MGNKVRASITFSPGLLEKIDNEADDLGVNRSAFVAMAVNSYFREKRMMRSIPKMLEIAKKVGKFNDSLSGELQERVSELGKEGIKEKVEQLNIRLKELEK